MFDQSNLWQDLASKIPRLGPHRVALPAKASRWTWIERSFEAPTRALDLMRLAIVSGRVGRVFLSLGIGDSQNGKATVVFTGFLQKTPESRSPETCQEVCHSHCQGTKSRRFGKWRDPL